jgi:hypothetical protein
MSNYKNVAAKVLKMVKSVGAIPRNGVNQKFSYKFVKETDVADRLREACLSVGLVVIPSVRDVLCTVIPGKEGRGDQYRTSLMLKLTLVDPDSGESMDMDFPGEAIDSQDKAVPKAITSAYKYGLLKLAMNGGGDGDDPEHDQYEQGNRGGSDKETKKDTVKPVQQGTTYRKPDEVNKIDGKSNAPDVGKSVSPKESTKGAGELAEDRPMSTRTEPQAKQESASDIVTLEDEGIITSVVPAMKGKPAQISFKRKSDGGILAIHFDAKTTDVPALLKYLNSKKNVKVICDVTTGNAHLMSITEA